MIGCLVIILSRVSALFYFLQVRRRISLQCTLSSSPIPPTPSTARPSSMLPSSRHRPPSLSIPKQSASTARTSRFAVSHSCAIFQHAYILTVLFTSRPLGTFAMQSHTTTQNRQAMFVHTSLVSL